MKIVATCARCSGNAKFSAFIAVPGKCIFHCESCGHNTWLDGTVGDFMAPRSVGQQQPQPNENE
jgi:hypothetical protein